MFPLLKDFKFAMHCMHASIFMRRRYSTKINHSKSLTSDAAESCSNSNMRLRERPRLPIHREAGSAQSIIRQLFILPKVSNLRYST